MAINFPASPNTNDTFTAGSITYKWDGAKWIGLGVTPADRLVEGSNSLEINASNELVWTGGTSKFGGVLQGDQRVVINGAGGKSGASNTLLNYAGDGSTVTASFTADGAASFSDQVVIGSGSAANSEYGLIAYADSNSTSNKSSVYARNIGGGRNFTGDNSAGATTFEVYSSGTIVSTQSASSEITSYNTINSGTGSNRILIRTQANQGGDPYIKFDAGGSNMVVGEYYQGTTSNQLVLGVGEDPTDTKGITINGLAQVVIGDYSMNSEILRVKGGEADIWLDSSTSGIWRILGSTGGNTHMFRVYDNTNSADRLNINASGRVRLPGIVGVAGSNLVNVSVEADGNLCTTTSIRAAKTNISPLADTSWLFDLNPVTFNWRTKTESEDGTLTWGEEADGGTQYGLIAEEVEEVKDDFCYYNNDGELSGVHYDRLVAPLLKVVQQQKEEIEALKARLDAGGL